MYTVGDRVRIVNLDTEECETQTDIPASLWQQCVGLTGTVDHLDVDSNDRVLIAVKLDTRVEDEANYVDLVVCDESELVKIYDPS